MKERRAPRAAFVVMRSAIAGSIVRSQTTTSKSRSVRAITMPGPIAPIPPATAATSGVEGGSGIAIAPCGMRSRAANNIDAWHSCRVRCFHRQFHRFLPGAHSNGTMCFNLLPSFPVKCGCFSRRCLSKTAHPLQNEFQSAQTSPQPPRSENVDRARQLSRAKVSRRQT
jgi:hypothetical protein